MSQDIYLKHFQKPIFQLAIGRNKINFMDSGHFLILATGWDKQRWIDTVLLHARLVENQIIIEEDNFEEGLTSALVAVGIKNEDIVTSLKPAVVS